VVSVPYLRDLCAKFLSSLKYSRNFMKNPD